MTVSSWARMAGSAIVTSQRTCQIPRDRCLAIFLLLATPPPISTDAYAVRRQTQEPHLSLIARFMTNGKNLTSYTLYSVTADILPELEKDRRAIFRAVFKEDA